MSNSQSWYNLLNMAITYLSANIYDIFNEYPNRLKTLNEKLLNEVLERVIRFERKNSFANKHKLFQLITECKQGPAGGSENLCRYMRANILNKKIHGTSIFIQPRYTPSCHGSWRDLQRSLTSAPKSSSFSTSSGICALPASQRASSSPSTSSHINWNPAALCWME